ncbi:manganese peroxidase 3 [Fomitiporia mediterranea MF3/22]|uniref:manganese peroxidase 3 n=1 Tax=Fomitiporia mediterranea (strain MF3/22) TaxID=694068 RepID=UPI0004407DE3|nr:manganese peroxidase 3 [Fomitiporia mediterranea MF3/22]EJD02557.1 manganese peroxidase 3 [Fomitiporia mediterranea MF3/22]
MVFKLVIATVALVAVAGAANYKRVTCPDGVNTATNEACCAFFSLRDDLQNNLFEGECSEDVHESLRLTFHDGVSFSLSGKFAGGGADGSILLFRDIETNFTENAGTDDGADALAPFLTRHLVSAGDLIQFAAAVGITNCPGAPRLQFLVGRPNATAPAQDGAIPGPADSVDTILSRFADAGFTTAEVIHLLASHTVARSDTIVPDHQAVPFDSTPFDFDTQFFLETLLKGTAVPFNRTEPNTAGGEVDSPLAAEGEMRLQSDFALARDQRTACEWQSMVDNQRLMMENFRTAMMKLSNVGQDTSKLVDCSELIPVPKPAVKLHATFPAGTSRNEVQQSCPLPFPVLRTDPGQATQIPECPNGDLNLADCPS